MEALKSDFGGKAHVALNDPKLRANFRRAMDGLMAKRAAQFPDAEEWKTLRARGAAVRARAERFVNLVGQPGAA